MTAVPGLDDLLDSARVVRIPLRMRFRRVTHREAMLLRGPAGWGEWAPFTEYGPVEAGRWLAAATEASWAGWPEPVRDAIAVNATVPAVPADQVAQVLASYDGFGAVKVKVAERGQSLADDVARVAAVRDVVGSSGAPVGIRLDANGGWALGDAIAAIARLDRAAGGSGLEYVEQPCMAVDDLARVRTALARRGVDVRIAADESIRKADDPMKVVEADAADLMIVKVAPMGGVANALRIAAEVGLPAVVSSALDTSVGIRAGVALAAALPELPFACGLATVELLDGDVCERRLVPDGGMLPVEPVTADAVSDRLLDRYSAPPDRQAWWRNRLADAHAHLSAADAAGSVP